MPPVYHQYGDILIAPADITVELLDVFASVGLAVTQPPQEVYDLVCIVQCSKVLTPELAHATILVCLNAFCTYLPTDNLLADTEIEPICDS